MASGFVNKAVAGYAGQFKEGTTVRHGYGKQIFSRSGGHGGGEDGPGGTSGEGASTAHDSYVGQWFDDQPHGPGVYSYASGAVFDGAFSRGRRHGRGRYTYANGATYDGDWDAGKRTGRGVFTSANGDATYDGTFVDGVQHGTGVCTYANGDRYEGGWVHGDRSGEGTLRLACGDVYRGQWRQDLPEGFGAFLSQSLRRKFAGVFSGARGLCEPLCTPQQGPIKRTAEPCRYPQSQPPPGTLLRCLTCGLEPMACPFPVLGAWPPGAPKPAQLQPRPQTPPRSAPPAAAAESHAANGAAPAPPLEGASAGGAHSNGEKAAAFARTVLARVVAGLGMAVADVPVGQRPAAGAAAAAVARPTRLRVAKVAPGSPAAALQLRRGDYIAAVNGVPVATVAALQGALSKLRPGADCAVAVVARDDNAGEAADARAAKAAPVSLPSLPAATVRCVRLGATVTEADFRLLAETVENPPAKVTVALRDGLKSVKLAERCLLWPSAPAATK